MPSRRFSNATYRPLGLEQPATLAGFFMATIPGNTPYQVQLSQTDEQKHYGSQSAEKLASKEKII